MAGYEETHPWLTFSINLLKAPARLWVMLGQCKELCDYINGVPLDPNAQRELTELHFTRGVLSATMLEGNTLTEDEVRGFLFGEGSIPPSKKYLAQENSNVFEGYSLLLDRIDPEERNFLNPQTVMELNRIVLDRLVLDAGYVPGQLRTDDISIPTHRYTLAPAADCGHLLDQLCSWLNSRTFDAPAGMLGVYGILKAIIAALYLEWIHPFDRGNARTTHLIGFLIMVESGLSPITALHFSRHYGLTKYEYYRQIEKASAPGGKIVPFISYSVQGLLDGLREQVDSIRAMQEATTWEQYVGSVFRDKTSLADLRRKYLALDLARVEGPVPVSALPEVSVRVAKYYSTKTAKTISRDVADLVRMGFIARTGDGVYALTDRVRAFRPGSGIV